MKKQLILLVILLAITATCAAGSKEPYLEGRNEAGGRMILLSSKPASCDGWYVMYTTSRSGDAAFGCWHFRNEFIHVVFADGTVRFFNPDEFRLINPPDLRK